MSKQAWLLVLLLSLVAPSSASADDVCTVTMHEQLCRETVSVLKLLRQSELQPQEVIKETLMAALGQTARTLSLLAAVQRRGAMQDCTQLMDVTEDQLRSALVISATPDQSEELRTLLSAAVTNHQTCMDSLSEASGPGVAVPGRLHGLLDRGMRLCSNALAVATHHYLPVASAEAAVADDGVPAWVSEGDRRVLAMDAETVAANADAVVALDGSGKFRSIAEAIAAAPDKNAKRYTILVKAGVYQEYLVIGKSKTNILLLGEGMDKTVITGSRNVVDGATTFNSATVAVTGKGFMARDIAFVNTAGWAKHQAVALRVGSDKSVFQRCRMEGYQDTLYAHSLRQFYRDCRILGTIDFIFGNAVMVAQNSTLLARKPGPSQKNAFTAQGRTDPNQNTGISIHGCVIDGDADLKPVTDKFPTYLGRPWKLYSRTVVMESTISAVVQPAGWLEWNGSVGLETLFYAEYLNSGAGAGTSGRIKWPGFHVLRSQSEAAPFTVGRFINADKWLDDAGVDHIDGFLN